MTPLVLQDRVSFWFGTGGAGFCISRALALKMSPFARYVGMWDARCPQPAQGSDGPTEGCVRFGAAGLDKCFQRWGD